MANYLAMRIRSGHLDYDAVMAKYPQMKDAIDKLVASEVV